MSLFKVNDKKKPPPSPSSYYLFLENFLRGHDIKIVLVSSRIKEGLIFYTTKMKSLWCHV